SWPSFQTRSGSGELPSSQLDIPWQLRGPTPEEPEIESPPAAPNLPGSDSGRMPILRVIGQVGAAYIIAEGPDGLYLIDQHAAHERILFEQFLAQWRGRQVASQGLVAAATVYLSPSQARLAEEHHALLA